MKELIDPLIGLDNAWVGASILLPHPQDGFEGAPCLLLDPETSIRCGVSVDGFAAIRSGWRQVRPGTGFM